MRRPGPLLQMTMALVTITVSLVLLADLLLGLTPDGSDQRAQFRRHVAESMAVQTAALLQASDATTLDRTLRDVVSRVHGVRSVAVRRSDGTVLVMVGPHDAAWKPTRDGGSTADQVAVPLAANGERWGTVEVAYRPDARSWIERTLDSPIVRLSLFLLVIGAAAYALYMRRALQHLDPSSVIPDRVQRAFDAMAEGVVVLDARSRVLLANKAFRALHPAAQQLRVGQSLSAVPWLAVGLGADAATHPWARAMTGRQNTSGDPLVVELEPAAPDSSAGPAAPVAPVVAPVRRLIVNCAPITDAGGGVRGCLTTFDDVSELHRTNEALQQAMKEAWAAKEEVVRKNVELQRLATRDALTGCLNRRAFMDGAPPLLDAAARSARPLGCLMLDIDLFKKINDTHGHGVGDLVIQEVARNLQQSARGVDLVCRYGGEEFCMILPDLDAEALAAAGERMRQRVEAETGRGLRELGGLRVTISVGAATLAHEGESVESLIDRADQALYEAKRGGRNRVVLHTVPAAAELGTPA